MLMYSSKQITNIHKLDLDTLSIQKHEPDQDILNTALSSFSTGLTQEDPSLFNWNIVDGT